MFISRRQMLAASGTTLFLPCAWSRGAEAEIASTEARASGFEEFTDQSEEALRRGNQWLLKTIQRNGGCGVDLGQQPDIGCTAMVGLALLSQGNTPIEGPHSREIRRIVAYLLRAVENMPANDITSAAGTQLQNKIGRHAHTFFATLFLSQVLGEGFDPVPVSRALARLVDTLAKAQTAEGNWGSDSWAPILGTVIGWVALRGAHFAGFHVEASAEKTAEHLLKEMQAKIQQQNGGWMHTLYKNATGIRVLYAQGWEHEGIANEAFESVLKVVTKDNTPFSQAGGEEFLAFHLITETMLQRGGKDWARWYPVVRDKIIGVQNSDGSWAGKHCITSRTFCTAAAELVLSAPNRYLPISQQ